MHNKFHKSIIIPTVCLSILSSMPLSGLASSFGDAQEHWAKDAIEVWTNYEVIQGDNGMFRPNDTITRAEIAVMINRIMNYQEKAENKFEDVDDTWYTDAVLKLAEHGVLEGYDGKLRPEDPVTREEALVMLSRALKIQKDSDASVSFEDAENISDWALDAVQAMADKGYINGYEDGLFRPGDDMTRACSVTVVNNTIKGFYNKPGTYRADSDIEGLVIVNTPDVILEGMTIKGDLIITPGVTDGVVKLNNTTVSGQQIVIEKEETGDEETPEGTPNPDASPMPSDAPSETAKPTVKPTSNPGGSGGGGGGSSVNEALATEIIVDSSYADKIGNVTYNSKRYTIGKNAFDTMEKAINQAQSLEKETSITILSDLTLENTLAFYFGDVTIDGKNHKLTFNPGVKDGIQIVQSKNVTIKDLSVEMQDEENKWNGSYGIQAYESSVKLSGVSSSGADAGILVNGAEVTLDEVVDVSGNEFGGIEVSKGAETTMSPVLRGTAENLKNDTETETQPTIWIDKVSELTADVVEIDGLRNTQNDRDQMYFFLNKIEEDNSTADVSTLLELEKALTDENVSEIVLLNDINSDKTLSVYREVAIKGKDDKKTVSFENKNGFQLVNAGDVTIENIKIEITEEESGWNGIYGLQVYGITNAVLKDIDVTGADAGILVNGADTTLEGVVDVSGNEFGGIEVSKGVDVTTIPVLRGTAANLKNDTETETEPTIWIDKVSELTTAVVEVTGLNEKSADRDQIHFFIGEITK